VNPPHAAQAAADIDDRPVRQLDSAASSSCHALAEGEAD
jgi:hypothetical protein